MKLIEKDGKFIAETTFAERMIPKGANFRWDPALKMWWTDDMSKAAKLASYANDELRVKFDSILKEKSLVIESSKASDANIEIPKPDGLEYLSYQKAGIAYAMSRKNVLIGDSPGLGKTVQAIGICNMDAQVKSVLIICPASLRLNWKREFEKWDVKSLSVGVAIKSFPTENVSIINYDVLKKFSDEIRSREWDVMIVDECHYLKNGKSLRAKEVFGFKEIKPIEAKRKIFLTGTPILNRPAEVWTLCHNLAPDVFKNWRYFMQRYAGAVQTRFGWDISGASNLEELQEKLRETIMVRRLKSDVLKELPAKRRQVIEIPANGAGGIVSKEKQAWDNHQSKIDQLKLAVELAKASDNEQDYVAAVQNLKDNVSAAFTEMSKLRHATALAKIPYVIPHIEDSLENGKVVVFAHHKDVIEKIVEAFPFAVVVTGDVSMENRQKAVDAFQNDPKSTLFVGNIQAAGVGLTLTASSHVIFVELDWVPGNMTQSEDRLHRIGQTNSVLVQHLVLEDSLDAHIAKRLIEKQEIIEKALDNPNINFVLPEKEETVTQDVTREQIEKQASEISEEEITLIQQGIRILSGYCDGANALDGMGFNKMDTGLGHSLAKFTTLSSKQAVLAKKLVSKYRRQLPEELREKIFQK